MLASSSTSMSAVRPRTALRRSAVAPLAARKATISARRGAVVTRAEAETKKWYALVANADFMLNDVNNESVAEQLREKVRFYKEQEKDLDFFLVCEPEWLDDLPQAKQVGRPAVAIVAADKMWITFMKLRLDRVLKVELGEMTVEEATKCGAPVPDFPELTTTADWRAPYSAYSKGWWEVFMPGMVKAE